MSNSYYNNTKYASEMQRKSSINLKIDFFGTCCYKPLLEKSLKDLKASFFDQVDNEKKLISDSYQLVADQINKITILLKNSK